MMPKQTQSRSFNSTMVRLKAHNIKGRIMKALRFNSTMVRLKEMSNMLRISLLRSFNSTMVRLKADDGDGDFTMYLQFQFHNGSIKSDHNSEHIERLERGFNSTMVRLKDATLLKRPSCRKSVSIPQWFD